MYQVLTDLSVQMQTNMLDPSDSVSIFSFLETCKQTYDSNGRREGAAMCCKKHLVTESPAAYLVSLLYLKCEKALDKPEGMSS